MPTRSVLLASLVALLLLPPVFAQPEEQMGPGEGASPEQAGPPESPGESEPGEDNETRANESKRGDHGRAARERDRSAWSGLGEDTRAKGLSRAEQARLFGRFDMADGRATGRFVSFGLDGGNVTNYTVRDTASGVVATYLTRVEAAGLGAAGEAQVHGSVLRLDGEAGSLVSHNNPTGMLVYRAENGTLDLTLLVPTNVTVTSEGARTMLLVAEDAHGHLIAHGNATLQTPVASFDGQRIDVSLQPGSSLLFLSHPARSLLAQNLHKLRDGIANERVGGILTLVKADDKPLEDRVFLGVDLETVALGPNRAEIIARSDEPGGKVVVLNLDQTVVNTASGNNVVVTLDGGPVARDDSSVVLNATKPLYHVERLDGGVQVIVNVPSFSEHTIVVSSTGAGSSGGSAVGTGGPEESTGKNGIGASWVALMAAAASAAALARARKR